MPAFERLDIEGGAAQTTLASGIDNAITSITIDSAVGWPDGSAGPFYFDLGYDPTDPNATYEKAKATGRTGTTITGVTRGVDGSAASSFPAGVTVRHIFTAAQADEANQHYADPTLDHHTNYLTVARHDVEARHTFGAGLGAPSAPASVGVASAAGAGDDAAREDHVHDIGTGAIDAVALFAAGVAGAAAKTDGVPGGGAAASYVSADVTPITAETTILTRSYTVSSLTATRNLLVLVKVYQLDDTDADVDFVVLRVKRDGVTIRGGAILWRMDGGTNTSGRTLVFFDEGVVGGAVTYTVTVNPNSAGEFGVIAAGGTGTERQAYLAVMDVGG